MKRILIIALLLISFFNSFAQRGSGFAFGIEGSALFNSATLPDIKVNTNINDILEGKELVKGKANYSDLTFNYRFGGFAKYDHDFGFALVELNYTTTKILKEIGLPVNSPFIKGNINLGTLERDFSYFDIAISYNIYFTDKLFFGVGIIPAFLLSNTGSQSPNKTDWRALAGFGFRITNNFSLTTRLELGINEVYADSYIHLIMIPVTVCYSF